MHKYTTKRCITAGILYMMIGSLFLCPCGARNSAYNWYCVRNTEHLQMKAAKELAFVEKYDGYYVDKRHGDGNPDKVVYLTFDAGYENGNVARVLDVLKEEAVPGAFFILGNLLTSELQLVERMIAEGHTVANHTMHHHDMTRVSSEKEFAAELAALEQLYHEKTGKEMSKCYRPPEGRFNEETMRYAKKLGYKTVFWSIAYADWDNQNQPSKETAREKILGNLHNGAVILLHPTSETNASVLKELITEIRKDGYRFGTLDELTK